ncbi:hypothetical protein KS083_26310, partial [Klebsiella pneumoniae subsp. ozaenae]|nr:hypothetical protein [Klebsiella pneumoniae subsp. ozaenae]
MDARNIELIDGLWPDLAPCVALKADTAALRKEYRETDPESQADSRSRMALDDLTFRDVIALAAFYPVPQKITEERL